MKRHLLGVILLLIATGDLFAQGYSPEEAVRRMSVPEGFQVTLVASEPLVRQPVCIEFDDRGRLWVIQYLQYPNPAGLKRVRVDRYSRTVYDRVPEPPPKGPRGADRITILEDTDGDGRMDRSRDFIDGLNLTTGIAFGHGGVFVLNVPYLLFYPDRNRDDVPDGDPEVLLTGFGMEDAHSVANSLTWGPDGWLYGCQGSTVTANIRGIEFQQGVWRYHPLTRAFELFCEGGGNSWGLDFDAVGNLFYSTNWGGFVMLHGLQGANYVKSFGKHGALHNPHAYGFFDHVPHRDFRGGHVTAGGIVYQGDSFPESFRGKYIAADLLGHSVYWHHLEPRASTFQSAHGGELLKGNDTWFAPTDLTLGPDGAVYVADWHDARTAHPDPDAEWDRSNGRIFKIAASGTKSPAPIDFAKQSNEQLLSRLDHRSQWYVRRARQELAHRREASIVPTLRERLLKEANELSAVETLWTLYVSGGFDEALAVELLASPHAAVRSWTIRFLGDAKEVSPEIASRLNYFAEKEPSLAVRTQVACSAARLPAHQAMPMINANIIRDVDHSDPSLPLLWWWAVERHSVSGREEVLKRFVRPSAWTSRLSREKLLPRLMRRYAAEGTLAGFESCLRLLKSAPNDADRGRLWEPLQLGLRENPRGDTKPKRLADVSELAELILASWRRSPENLTLLALAMSLGVNEPRDVVRQGIANMKLDVGRRAALIGLLAESGDASAISLLTPLALSSSETEPIRSAALTALARFDDERIATELLAAYQKLPPKLQSQTRDLLLDRPASARLLLKAVDLGDIKPADVPLDQIRRVAVHDNRELDELVTKHWGKLQAATREEKLAEVRRLSNDLRAGPGDAASGKAVFKKHCATCHQLFGEGAKLGPDLTTANRKDQNFLLISLVDPSSVIRKEFVSAVVQTKDGRVLTGLIVDRSNAAVTLVNAKNERQTIAESDIDEFQESPISLMPDNQYQQLKPQELRDLFRYLSGD